MGDPVFDKRLISMVPGAMRCIVADVAFQWVALVANIALFLLIGSFIQNLVEGAADGAALATLLAAGEYITCRDLPAEVTGGSAEPAEAPLSLRDPASEEEQIRRALATAGGNKSQAAKLLGIDRKTLYNKLHLYGIE